MTDTAPAAPPNLVRFGRRSSRGLLLGFSAARVACVGPAEKQRRRPRDERRPNRTRLGGAAGAVSVMACAHFCSWGAAGHAAFGWARGGWAIAGLVVSQAVAPLGAPLRPSR